MTGKLVKYELKSSIRILAILWAALLASAVLVGFFLDTLNDWFVSTDNSSLELMSGLLQLILPVLYGGIFMAVIIVTILLVIMRFYKGILSDEGYLMHTLPVKPWQLITAKGIVASAIVTISIIAAVLSILILVAFGDFKAVMEGLGVVFGALADDPKYILIVIEAIIVIVFGIVKSVYQIYAAMAIGQLAAKYRALLSLGAYFGISTVLSILGALLITLGDAVGIDATLVYMAENMEIFSSPFGMIQGALALMFAVTAVQVVAFHVVAERLLTKKLNLI